MLILADKYRNMKLKINSVYSIESIKICIEENNQLVVEKVIMAKRAQAEKLLPAIEKMLIRSKRSLKDIKEIVVQNDGVGFTSLRIGVVVANALGYALGVPVYGSKGESLIASGFSVVQPYYEKDPNITQSCK